MVIRYSESGTRDDKVTSVSVVSIFVSFCRASEVVVGETSSAVIYNKK